MCAHRTNRTIRKYGALLTATIPFLMLGSCISDKEVESDDYCFVWEVSLGTMKREVVTQNALGNDTTITSTYTGSEYPMTINQRELMIENRDSLLYGTVLNAVLVNISYSGSSMFYRPKGDEESPWVAYNSSDSMDLRKPVELLLTANDGLSSRLYTLKLNVHKLEGDSLYWKKADAAVPQLQGLTQQRAVVLQGNPAFLGRNGDAVKFVERTAEGVWAESSVNLPLTADVQTLTKKGDSLFVSTSEGDIYTTTDGKDWQKINAPQRTGLVLAGATASGLYALTADGLYRCSENGAGEWTFQPEGLDESPSCLPSEAVRLLQISQSDGSQRLVLAGNRADAAAHSAVVWNKTWNSETPEAGAAWMYMNQTEDNKRTLPQLEYLNLIQYDGKCLAFGGASVAGKGSHVAMDALYISEDYGISWQQDDDIRLPAQLKGVSGPVSSVVDDNNVIWIIANGEVWRGKLNRLDFLRQ